MPKDTVVRCAQSYRTHAIARPLNVGELADEGVNVGAERLAILPAPTAFLLALQLVLFSVEKLTLFSE